MADLTRNNKNNMQRLRSASVGCLDYTQTTTAVEDIVSKLPKGAVVTGAYVNVITAFTGAGVTALTADVGVSGNAIAFFDNVDLTATGVTASATPEGFYADGENITITTTETGGTATQGELEVIVEYVETGKVTGNYVD